MLETILRVPLEALAFVYLMFCELVFAPFQEIDTDSKNNANRRPFQAQHLVIEIGQVAIVGGWMPLDLVTHQHAWKQFEEVHIATFPGSSILMGRLGPSEARHFL